MLLNVLAVAVVGASHWVADHFFAPHSRTRTKAVWFTMHALCNFVIAALALPAVLHGWEHALHPAQGVRLCTERVEGMASSALPILVANWLHVWHACFFTLTSSDLVHHLLFIPLIGVPGAWWNWGLCGNWQIFAMCGVPGGVVYTILALQTVGRVRWISEPWTAAAMNVCVRAPCIVPAQLWLWSAFLAGTTRAAPWAVAAQLSLAPANVAYYAWQSVARARRKRASAATVLSPAVKRDVTAFQSAI